MFQTLKRAFAPDPYARPAAELYAALVKQSRQPFLYRDFSVPDTLDGRFELILLHLFLVLERLARESATEAEILSQRLSEAFIADMDRSLREMGVGDVSISRKMKNVTQAFFGRMKAYQQVWRAQHGDFEETLRRNVYGTLAEPEAGNAQPLKDYALRVFAVLEKTPASDLMEARLTLPCN